MPLPAALSDTYSAPLEQMIARIFDEFKKELPEISADGEWAINTLQDYSLRPSKRIRGALAAAMYDHVGEPTASDDALRLGAAVEIVQNYLLIVDDVMDHSELRRGKPAVHKLYEAAYQDADGHEAQMAGILVGLLAQHCANLALLKGSYEPGNLSAALRLLHLHMTITDIGQIDDMRQQINHLPITSEALLRKYQQKSSYYSFVNPLQMALVLAGKDGAQAEQEALSFGLPTGVAFQLRDDYLGLFGESSATGKPNLDDIREGKYTFMIHYALEKATSEEKESLLAILGTPSADEHALKAVRKIVTSTGAGDWAQDEAKNYAEKAKEAARSSNLWDGDFTDMLCELIDFILEREV